MRFIRKNGHVIPIRDGAEKSGSRISPQPGTTGPSGKPVRPLVKGAVLGAVGIATAHVSGKAAGALVQSAAGAEKKARTAFVAMRVARIGKQTPKLIKVGERARFVFRENIRLRNAYWKSSLNVRHAGLLTGAALVGLGTNEALKEAPGFKDHPEARAAVGGGAALGTHFVIRHAFERYMGGRGLKTAKSAAIFTLKGFARKFRGK